jgi:hypothetical protein
VGLSLSKSNLDFPNVAGRVVDIDLEKYVISPVKVTFKQC